MSFFGRLFRASSALRGVTILGCVAGGSSNAVEGDLVSASLNLCDSR